MEDLTFGMVLPCIMDVKIGSRLWDIDATADKRMRRQIKSSKCGSGWYGFRICGIRDQLGNRIYARELSTLKKDGISKVLNFYFGNRSNSECKAMVEDCLAQLERIREMLQNTNLQLISSSLLFVYDGANPSKTFMCKMIDFAHSHIHKQSYYDVNYLHGLDSFISTIKQTFID